MKSHHLHNINREIGS